MNSHASLLQRAAAKEFFAIITKRLPPFNGAFLVVTHALPSVLPFLDALSTAGRIAGVIPKPSSIDVGALETIRASYPVLQVDRQTLASEAYIQDKLLPLVGNDNCILLDVGGYFAAALSHLHDRLGKTLLGVVEDTENGHQRYARLTTKFTRIASVARSLSKRYEDRWVGQAIIYSAEAIVRNAGATLIGKRAYVIGFGKIGQSVAHNLKNRGLNVTTFDLDSHQRLYARCKDFLVASKADALPTCDLIFCATGNKALAGGDFELVKSGAIVFSVTSGDDELDLRSLEVYEAVDAGFALTRYSRGEHYFYLANRGNAVNFLHGAEVRPYIHLVQAAILMSILRILTGEILPGSVQGVSREDETFIADAFEECFFPDDITCGSKSLR